MGSSQIACLEVGTVICFASSPVEQDVLVIQGAPSSRLAYLCVSNLLQNTMPSPPWYDTFPSSSCGTALFSDGEFQNNQ